MKHPEGTAPRPPAGKRMLPRTVPRRLRKTFTLDRATVAELLRRRRETGVSASQQIERALRAAWRAAPAEAYNVAEKV
jgi:hypothetical protein